MNTTKCIHCNERLSPTHTGKCPNCGGEGRAVSIGIAEEVDVANPVHWMKVKEYYEDNKGFHRAVTLLTFVPPFLGLLVAGWIRVIVSLPFSILAYFPGPKARTKIKEIEKGS